MKSLRSLKKIIREQLGAIEHKSLVEIHYDSNFTVTQVLDHIRALCGIIIVNAESSERLTDRKQKVLAKIKFYVAGPTATQYLATLVDKALDIDGVYAFRIKKVRKITKEV